MRRDKLLALVVEGSGVMTALAAVVASKSSGTQAWTLPLVSTSILALWIASIWHNRLARSHYLKTEALMRTAVVADSEEDLVAIMTLRLLQAITFTGSQIDDEIWVKHGADILSDKSWNPLERLDYLLEAKRTGCLELREPHTYDLFDLLSKRAGDYRATTEKVELFRKQSSDYIYLRPLGFPTRVKRIFILDDIAVLRELPEEKRMQLKNQLDAGVELRFVRQIKNGGIPNIAIFGFVAVGILTDNGSNVVDFNHHEIQRQSDAYDRLWARAEPVGSEHLGI
jgi:hypothetical protein